MTRNYLIILMCALKISLINITLIKNNNNKTLTKNKNIVWSLKKLKLFIIVYVKLFLGFK